MATIPQLRPENPPFADYFCVSTPSDTFEELVDSVLAVLDALGGFHERPGLYRLSCALDGTVKYSRRHRVGTIDFSGDVLRALRSRGVFTELLYAIALHPHRVTMFHATLDVVADSPSYVRDAYNMGNRGDVFLTRKAVSHKQVTRLVRQAAYDAAVETGSVYLGKRGAAVSLLVYDKRNEMLNALIDALPSADSAYLALNDPGPLLRWELKLGRNVGCTLRDVADPTAVFWHHLSESGLPLRCPDGIPSWEPLADGYSLPAPPERLPWQQVEMILEHSPDVKRLLKLSAVAGAAGPAMLVNKLKRMVEAIQRDLAAVGPAPLSAQHAAGTAVTVPL